jgi:hypothetical protein
MLSQPSAVPGAIERAQDEARPSRDYSLYGMAIRSEIPLSYRERGGWSPPDVTISLQLPHWFGNARRDLADMDTSSSWYEYGVLPDGSDYLRWPSLFEFVVSADGRHVAAGQLANASAESFQSYLLGWVLSFALVKQGYEPLHATAVVVDGKAVAFLGTSGHGKSTLAASFLHCGHTLLTDDLLLIREIDGRFVAFPGPPRIKLFPHVAAQFQPRKVSLGPMNPESDKVMIALERHEVHDQPVPMHGFVVLDVTEAPECLQLEPLSPHESFLALVAATFNDRLRAADRLQRQFRVSAAWTDRLSARRATYPRTFSALAAMQRAIVRDVRGESQPDS